MAPMSEGVLMLSRRRARRARQDQLRIPDWAWGVLLGLAVLMAVGGYFFITGGGGGGPCDGPLPSLPGGVSVSAEGFKEVDDSLGQAIVYLNQRNLDDTYAEFYGDTHAFTHNIDPDIRDVNEGMAGELCELVIQVEEDYDPPPPEQRSFPKMISSTEALREHLRDVAEELGFDRPGG